MNELKPMRIPAERVPVETETPTFRVARLVESGRSGSELVLGLAWMDPGGPAVSWTADAETHEAYYLVHGALRVGWDGATSGSEELGPEDAFFPPGCEYSIENSGEEQVSLVWALTPSLPRPKGASGGA